MYNPNVNVICGDLLQMFSNFTCLTNREILRSNNPMFNLYGELDIFKTEMNAKIYSELVENAIVPGKLNIVEGGSSFYLSFLRTHFLKDYNDLRSLYMYYDHKFCGPLITERVEILILMGLLQEYFEFTKYHFIFNIYLNYFLSN